MGDQGNDPWVLAILGQSEIASRFVDLKLLTDPTKGFFSIVFDAFDIEQRRRVILKFLRPDRAAEEYWRRCFEREGEIATALRGHPNIVQLVPSAGVHMVNMKLDTGLPIAVQLQFLATERGVSDFDSYLFAKRARPSVLWRRLEIVRDVVKGVARLHRLGFCHRDLKPDNIFLFPGGSAKLGDLGLCRSLSDQTLLGEDYSGPVGHKGYAAPELFCGAGRRIDLYTRADWFAVGSILFETVSGVNLYVAIGLQSILEIAVLFSQHETLDRFEQVVGDIAGSYPIPLLEDYMPQEMLGRYGGRTLTAVDGLIRSLCHFDHRRRLCDFHRTLQRLDVAIARARQDETVRSRRLAQRSVLARV